MILQVGNLPRGVGAAVGATIKAATGVEGAMVPAPGPTCPFKGATGVAYPKGSK